MKRIGLTLLTAFVGGAMALGAYKLIEKKYADDMSFEDKQQVYFTSNRMSPAITSSAGEVDFTQAAAAVTPAVVYIRTTYTNSAQQSQQDKLQQMFGDMFGGGGGQRSSAPQMASGSGVIISPDGYIVTNNHVVAKADKIDITTNDHRRFTAKVIGTDPNTDLALIKIEATNLPIVKLGNSDDAKVGEWVLAVGNPFNLTSTVTAGIVSAKGRGIGIIGQSDGDDDNSDENPFGPSRMRSKPKVKAGIESFIQTDAAINPGNSGGALVNTRGELIGINSAIASHTGSYEGYGFAIPVNLAKKVLNDIKKYGTVKRGMIGVSFADLSEVEPGSGLKTDKTNGLYINSVISGSGGEAAGLKAGDIITKVEGVTVYESSDLQERVGRLQPGDKINLTVLRDGSEKNFAVTLKAEAAEASTALASKSGTEIYSNKLGARFTPLSERQKAKYRVNGGIVVTQVREGGMFDSQDIPIGTIITSINKQTVYSGADIDKAITNLQNGLLIISGVYPDGTKFNNKFAVGQ
jgi:serine protease Do